MNPPFSHDAFLDVFASDNLRLWPFAVALWVASAVVGLERSNGTRPESGVDW